MDFDYKQHCVELWISQGLIEDIPFKSPSGYTTQQNHNVVDYFAAKKRLRKNK